MVITCHYSSANQRFNTHTSRNELSTIHPLLHLIKINTTERAKASDVAWGTVVCRHVALNISSDQRCCRVWRCLQLLQRRFIIVCFTSSKKIDFSFIYGTFIYSFYHLFTYLSDVQEFTFAAIKSAVASSWCKADSF